MNDKKFLFVCDFFEEEYVGGAELTTSALMQERKYQVERINCRHVDTDFVLNNKNKIWIIGNFSSLTSKSKYNIIKNNIKYYILEYDYKYCLYRNPSLHAIKEGECDCEKLDTTKILNIFFHKAEYVFYMSERQKKIYYEKMKNLNNGVVLSSVFKKDNLDFIDSLRNVNKDKKWLIYETSNYLKGTQNGISYALKNKLDYLTFKNLPHRKVIELLAKSKGLIFLPNGEDTCPRLVIEAKLCNCEIIHNDKVQHCTEDWFLNSDVCMDYMRTRAQYFWRIIDESL